VQQAESIDHELTDIVTQTLALNHSPIRTRLIESRVMEERMSTIEKSIEVNVPEYKAYAQWMHFEDFPQFMEGVKEVTQLDAKRFHWKAEIVGQDKEWDTEITEQMADQRLAWTSRGGVIKRWVVTFHPLSNARSKVMLQLEYDPQDLVENVGDALEVVVSRVQGDLERFKAFTEKRWSPPSRETIFDNFPM
jgi:uncharacterized membrane protein